MLIVPFVVGVLDTGPRWAHLPLLFAWLVGYLAFFATGLWLRSHRKARYWPPVRGYTAATVILGLIVVLLDPALLRWAVVYGPLLAISLWCSWNRADRTLLNDGVTIVAACLMAVVVSGVGTDASDTGLGWLPGAGQTRPWLLAGLLLAYFAGTVLYVKSMIRNRGDRAWYRLSVGYHVAVCVPAIAAGAWLGALFAVFAIRAALVPRAWPKLTPPMLGVGEIVASLALATLLLLG